MTTAAFALVWSLTVWWALISYGLGPAALVFIGSVFAIIFVTNFEAMSR